MKQVRESYLLGQHLVQSANGIGIPLRTSVSIFFSSTSATCLFLASLARRIGHAESDREATTASTATYSIDQTTSSASLWLFSFDRNNLFPDRIKNSESGVDRVVASSCNRWQGIEFSHRHHSPPMPAPQNDSLIVKVRPDGFNTGDDLPVIIHTCDTPKIEVPSVITCLSLIMVLLCKCVCLHSVNSPGTQRSLYSSWCDMRACT